MAPLKGTGDWYLWAAWLGGLSCLHPTPLGAPPHPLGPEGAAFSGPHPPGTTWGLAVGSRGTEETSSARARSHVLCTHQALMMSKACPSQPSSPAPALGIPTLVSPEQRPCSCSPPSL